MTSIGTIMHKLERDSSQPLSVANVHSRDLPNETRQTISLYIDPRTTPVLLHSYNVETGESREIEREGEGEMRQRAMYADGEHCSYCYC